MDKLTAEKAWDTFWEKHKLADETFIAPGYVAADKIAAFAEEYAASMLPAPVEPKELAEAVQILVRVQEVLRDNDLLYAAEGLRIPIGILLHARAPRLTEEQREADGERIPESCPYDCPGLGGYHEEVKGAWYCKALHRGLTDNYDGDTSGGSVVSIGEIEWKRCTN